MVRCTDTYLIAAQNGYTKIGEKIVKHQARRFGYTKFGLTGFSEVSLI